VTGAAGQGPEAGRPAAAGEGEEDGTAGFRRTRGGVSARFTAAQAVIVRSLVSQVAELVGGDAVDRPDAPPGPLPPGGGPAELAGVEPFEFGGPATAPDDPVLARLLPDGYREDPAAAGEFRQYTEPALRAGKVAAARTVLGTLPAGGGRVRLAGEDAQDWLRALNDVRLAIGTVLGITEDYEDELSQADSTSARAAYLEVYHWLGYLQDSLVRALW
jgi:Domain of unknown function (DUF2017)